MSEICYRGMNFPHVKAGVHVKDEFRLKKMSVL